MQMILRTNDLANLGNFIVTRRQHDDETLNLSFITKSMVIGHMSIRIDNESKEAFLITQSGVALKKMNSPWAALRSYPPLKKVNT